MHDAGTSSPMKPFVDAHLNVQSYRSTISDKGKHNELDYSDLECEYVEEVFSEGIRGAVRVGTIRQMAFAPKGRFAVGRLFYQRVPGWREYRFYLSVDFLSVEVSDSSCYEAELLPLLLSGLSPEDVETRRVKGTITEYLLSEIGANYVSDVIDACGLTDLVVDGLEPMTTVSQRIRDALRTHSFAPLSHEAGPVTSTTRLVEIHGTCLFQLLKELIEKE